MLYDIKYETFMFNLEHIKIEQYLKEYIKICKDLLKDTKK